MRFEGLRADEYMFCAEDDDDAYVYACLTDVFLTPGEVRDVELQLERGFSVEGTILDRLTDAPMADMQATFGFIDETDGETYWESAMTDASGVYRLHGLRPGSYRVSASLGNEGYPYFETRLFGDVRCAPAGCPEGEGSVVELVEAVQGVDFRIGPAAGLSGRIVDVATGTAIPNVTVSALLMSMTGPYAYAGTVTDEDGKFSLTYLKEGFQRLRTSEAGGYLDQRWPGETCQGYHCNMGQEFELGPTLPSDGFDFSLSRGHGIPGALVNAITGKAVRARIEVLDEEGFRVWSGLADTGTYATGALMPGSYHVMGVNPDDNSDCEYFFMTPCSKGAAAATPVIVTETEGAASIDLAIDGEVIAADGFEPD